MSEINMSNDDLMRAYNSKLADYCGIETEMDKAKKPAEEDNLIARAINLFPELNRLLGLIRARGVDTTDGQAVHGFTLEPQQLSLAS